MIAPLILGVVLLGAGWYFLLRPHPPGGSFEPVGTLSSFPQGSARSVHLPGVFIAHSGESIFALLQDDGCTLLFCNGRFVDCRGVVYRLDGKAPGGRGALDLLPVVVYRGEVYVDPDHPIRRPPATETSAPIAQCP